MNVLGWENIKFIKTKVRHNHFISITLFDTLCFLVLWARLITIFMANHLTFSGQTILNKNLVIILSWIYVHAC